MNTTLSCVVLLGIYNFTFPDPPALWEFVCLVLWSTNHSAPPTDPDNLSLVSDPIWDTRGTTPGNPTGALVYLKPTILSYMNLRSLNVASCWTERTYSPAFHIRMATPHKQSPWAMVYSYDRFFPDISQKFQDHLKFGTAKYIIAVTEGSLCWRDPGLVEK
jgi:hypothetical protein